MKVQFSGALQWSRALDAISPQVTRKIRQHSDMLYEGQTVEHAVLLLNGAACRYKNMGGGRRAIVGIIIPGDFATPVNLVGQSDVGISALTECDVLEIPIDVLRTRAAVDPDLARLLEKSAWVEGATLRSWVANLSQQAPQRVAHLLCEIRHRLAMVQLASRDNFRLPLRQCELADALGCSSVHINRVLQELRRLDLIRTSGQSVLVPNLERLEAFAGFNAAYLHLGQEHQAIDDLIEAEAEERSKLSRANAPGASTSPNAGRTTPGSQGSTPPGL